MSTYFPKEGEIARKWYVVDGGLRSEDFRKRFARKPELVIEDAIVRMLPKTKLGRHMASKLKIYRGDKHRHEAQKPEARALEART